MRVAALLFVGLAVFYYQTTGRELSDFRYMALVAHAIWHDGEVRLDAWAPPPWGPQDGVPVADALPYQLTVHAGHVYHAFPAASALLIAPLVGGLDALGRGVVDERGAYDARQEARALHLAASLCMAALVALFFVQARLLLGVGPALAVALSAGLATPIWSVGASTLWSHAFAMGFVAVALTFVLRAERLGAPPPGLVVGTALAWAYFVRPTAAISVAVLVPYLLWRWRGRAAPTIATGACWALLFGALSFAVWDAPLPPYHRGLADLRVPGAEALLGPLLSPARGLFVYAPVLLWLAALLHFTWARLPHRALVVAGGVACALQWGIVAAHPHWWGGHSWGPRLMLDVAPWWVLLGVLGISAAGDRLARDTRWRRFGLPALGLALAIGVALNGIGSHSRAARHWSADAQIDSHPERLWDWRDPPFGR